MKLTITIVSRIGEDGNEITQVDLQELQGAEPEH
jgi:hypothetical protein